MFWLNGHVSPEGRLLGVAVKNGEEAFHEELHLILRPHDPVGMEGRVGCLSAWEGVPRANSAPSRLRRVDCGVVPRGTCSVVYLWRPVLHDVGFAAGGPSTLEMLLPRVQNAGDKPWFVVLGSWMLASRMPYWKFCLPSVFMRPDIQVPLTFLGWITRCPLPSMYTGAVEVLNVVGH